MSITESRPVASGCQLAELAPAAPAPLHETSGMTDHIRQISDPADLADLVSDALAEAYTLATRRGQAAREDLHGLTISALGGCTRQAAYRMAGTEPSDPDLATGGEHRAANHGTWLDNGLTPLLAEVTGGRAQVRTEITAGDRVIPGTADLVFGGVVLDLKSVRESRLTRVIGSGPFPSNRMQGLGYGLGLHQQGAEVNWVVYLYLDRSTGTEHPVCERFTQTSIMTVLRRVWEIERWSRRPDWAPRTEHGPGLSLACDNCEWLQRCWGKGARPRVEGPQRRLARERGAIARVLVDYQRLGTQIREMEAERKFLRAIFTAGSRAGNYGDLRWYQTADGQDPDPAAMVEILTELGIPIPHKPRSGQVRIGAAKRAAGPRAVRKKAAGTGRKGRKAS